MLRDRVSAMARVFRLMASIAMVSTREPKSAVAVMRHAVAAALDEHFDRCSPIPYLPDSYRDTINQHEITLPPSRLVMPGNQTFAGLQFLVSLARALDVQTVFEIGTYNGLTAYSLARNVPSATINTLDLPPGELTAFELGPHDVGNRLDAHKPVFDILPHSGRVSQLWGDSARFDFAPWYGRIDLVYVDGSHTEEYVVTDTTEALKMVSSHGAIVWDDYWRRIPGVAKVLNQRTDLNLYRVPGTRLVVHLSEGAMERWTR